MTDRDHALYIISVLRRRAEAERNANDGCETRFARCLTDAADLIHNAYHPDVVDVPTGGRL